MLDPLPYVSFGETSFFSFEKAGQNTKNWIKILEKITGVTLGNPLPRPCGIW